MTKSKLSKPQAIAWATAEVVLVQAQAAVTAAKQECEKFRARHESRLAPSDDPKDADKNVKVGRAGGWQIRFTRFKGGDYFSLKDYLAGGGKITAAMEPHVHEGREQVRVTVKRIAGPTKPGSVEPA